MALDKARLTASLTAKLVAANPSPAQLPTIAALAAAISDSVIDELQANGEVDPSTGVPPMSNSGGPVAGRGRIL